MPSAADIARSLSGDRRAFMALTLVVIVAIIIISPSMPKAVDLIGLVTSFFIISTAMITLCEKQAEGLAGRSAAGLAPRAPFAAAGGRPGREGMATGAAADAGDEWYPGAVGAPAETNPFDLSQAAGGAAGCRGAPGCAPDADDEAAGQEALEVLDGDEQATQQQQSRNDDRRPHAGIHNRRRMLDGFMREEVNAEEETRWWGRDEW